MLDADFVKDIAYNNNIENILDNLGIEYQHELSGWVVLQCMFHDGTNFNLKFRGDGFYCFSQCRKPYSIFDIICKVKNVEFIEALHWLAKLLGIEDDGSAINVDKETKSYISNLKKFQKSKHKTPVKYKKLDQSILNTVEMYHHNWIRRCGFTEDTCRHFNIGYARTGSLDGRVCFPIRSPDGQVVSISGRMPDAEALGLPRYHVVGHTSISQTLYHLSDVLKNINEYDFIIVVEGFKSVIRLYQEGYHNAIAVMGASLSKVQRNLLLKTGKDIIVICDNDLPGEQFGQAVYNQCYQMADVRMIKLADITEVEKASVDDLTPVQFNVLSERIIEL